MRLISVVLPVYNESESIGPCLRGLASALASEDHEILVCYDSEEDTTLPAIAAMSDRSPQVRLVRNSLGRGALNAIRTGFLSDPPAVILEMAKAIRSGADVVSGSRYMRGGSQSGGPWLKRTLSRIAGVSLRWIAGLGTYDATSNFRGYSRAFLDSVTIESRGGFEIALELTVKAHLAGKVVTEVPSSWVDRSAGKSNFRLWRWMPSYLRWYLRALLEPAIVWAVAALAFLLALSHPSWAELPVLIHRSTAIFCAASAASALLLARRLRRRTRLVDALHAPSLMRSIGFAILCASIWIAHANVPRGNPGNGLDGSWQAALDRAVVLNLRAGVDYVFTYGPLGTLRSHAYTSELFEFKLLAWDGVLLLSVAILMIRVASRIRGKLDRALFLVLLVYPTDIDAYVFIAILGVMVWALERERLGFWTSLLGLSILVVFSFTKFSYATPAILCALAIMASHCWRHSWTDGAKLGMGFLLLVALLWWMCGQDLRDLPIWIHRSLELASGYGEGCSTPAPTGTRGPAAALIGLFAVQSLLLVFASPRSFRRWTMACVLLPILWVAFKGGFVRAADHTTTFFGFTLLAPFLFATVEERGRAERRTGQVCRLACVAISFMGVAAADRPTSTWTDRLVHAGGVFGRTAALLFDPVGLRELNESDLASARSSLSLPRTRSVVGDRSIDMVSSQQGLLFLNDLRWNPRPVFQGYLTFSTDLMALNTRFLESERASEFILFRLESIDRHLPTMEDALALQVIARDYEAVLAEAGFLLLHHAPRVESWRVPQVQLETEIRFGETLDLSGLEGSCHLLSLDIASTPWGRARSLLEKTPILETEIVLDSGETLTMRIVPDMMRAGVIFDPFLRSQLDWMAWTMGGRPPRPVRLRILGPVSPSMYRANIGVKVLRADGIAPIARPDLAREATFSWFKTLPSEAQAAQPPTTDVLGGETVLLFRAPSEIRFEVAAGKHRLTGRYGILARDWQPGGADFSGVLRMPGREEVVVFEKHLDPIGVERDRRLNYLDAHFEAPVPATLILRTNLGPGPDSPSHETVWSEIQVN